MFPFQGPLLSTVRVTIPTANSEETVVLNFYGLYYKLVVVDQLTKMAHFMPCNNLIRWSQVKKLRDSLWIIFTNTMAFLTTSSPIVIYNSLQSFGNHYSRSLRSRSSYLPHVIIRLMDK
jgi:hypothetical protein